MVASGDLAVNCSEGAEGRCCLFAETDIVGWERRSSRYRLQYPDPLWTWVLDGTVRQVSGSGSGSVKSGLKWMRDVRRCFCLRK